MKPKRVKVREMEITVKAVPLPTYKIKKDSHPDKFTYDDLKQIRINVSKLMDKYYGYLRQTVSHIFELSETFVIQLSRCVSRNRSFSDALNLSIYDNSSVISLT